MSNIYKNTKGFLSHAARADIFFYLLIWLMELLIIGTVAEKYLGLYQAQKLFFSSFIIWVGGLIPVPGGYTTLTLIFFNLLAKLTIERWTKQKIGTLIVHCGALLLLVGGFLTAALSSEGNMVIEEGGASNYVSDYHQYELTITDDAQDNRQEVTFPQEFFKPEHNLTSDSLPFKIKIDEFYENCTIIRRPELLTDGTVHGMLVANEMKPAHTVLEDEKNRSGIIFSVVSENPDINGRYAIFEDMPIEQHLDISGKKYLVTLRHKRTILPFEVGLIKFEKQIYPGTDKPRSFQSEVVIKDDNIQWHSLVSMNNPLRYKGYTFYQASFIEGESKQTTVLAVVKNVGAIFPYISSITICIGLLIHLFIRIPKLKMGKPEI
ncbi:MAG: cytochrome c biogenesis protein ResB [Rickettsiales bacterium]|nr:cytochrome c biogenesis protein ResB [Rickettsiales bacterium]